MRNRFQKGGAIVFMLALGGCSSLPGNDRQQGAVIGGATGAAVGAAVTDNRVLGAVIGGAVGAAGGYVIGKNKDTIFGDDSPDATEAARRSEQSPVTPEAARAATTADANLDGFVTLDEVVAMEQAGLSDDEMIRRLRATHQVFELNDGQKKYLTSHGVSPNVVQKLPSLNESIQAAPADTVISQPSPR